MLACPFCRIEIRMNELDHPGLFKNYRVCPNCGGTFTPDIRTKYRQAVFIVIAFISLILMLLLYFEGTDWLTPAVISYLILGFSIYHGNKLIYLVPYEKD